MSTRPIIKQKTRILTPYLYGQLRAQLNPTYQAISDVLIHTGMRVEEFWEFLEFGTVLGGLAGWYDPQRKCIDMPHGSIKKIKSLHKERTIILSDAGCKAVEHVLRMNPKKIPRQSMWITYNAAAKKAGLGNEGITSKMFRKSLISWLAVCHEDKMYKIASSAGHTLEIMRLHYSSLQFEARDVQEMKEFLKGWGEA